MILYLKNIPRRCPKPLILAFTNTLFGTLLVPKLEKLRTRLIQKCNTKCGHISVNICGVKRMKLYNVVSDTWELLKNILERRIRDFFTSESLAQTIRFALARCEIVTVGVLGTHHMAWLLVKKKGNTAIDGSESALLSTLPTFHYKTKLHFIYNQYSDLVYCNINTRLKDPLSKCYQTNTLAKICHLKRPTRLWTKALIMKISKRGRYMFEMLDLVLHNA